MSERDENLDRVRSKIAAIDEFTAAYKAAEEILPHLKQIREVAQWEADMLADLPPEASAVSQAGLSRALEADLDFVSRAVPPPLVYDFRVTASAAAVSASGVTEAFEFVSNVQRLGTPTAAHFGETHSERYRQLQASQQREQQVADLVRERCSSGTLSRFERAVSAAASAANGIANPTIAAIEIRTFMDGVKGDLVEAAREPGEQKVTIHSLSTRLAVGGPESPEASELEHQWAKRTVLYDRLSSIGKDRQVATSDELRDLWVEVLDHLYAVLALVRREH